MRDNFLRGSQHKCPRCGKTFWASQEWVYCRGYEKHRRYFCSWKCLREEERENPTMTERINQAIRDGLTDSEIKKHLGVTQRQIDFRKEKKG